MSESWFPVVGFENEYRVSTELRVESLRRRIMRSNGSEMTVPGKFLTPILVRGCKTVFLVRDKQYVHRSVSALLREAQEVYAA